MGDHEADGGEALSGRGTEEDAIPGIEALEEGRFLFAQSCDFVGGAVTIEGLPAAALPEVAFVGRSNVGKSSLINALTGRRTLARISKEPGRTREINFFELGERLMLVDLPGYGYAKAPKQAVKRWTELIGLYLRGREGLRRVCLLVDARHGIKESDQEVMRLLDRAAVVYHLVLTKVDAPKAAVLECRLAETADGARAHAAAHPEVIATSARTGAGIPELRAALAELAETR